jgi:hypothetical protein
LAKGLLYFTSLSKEYPDGVSAITTNIGLSEHLEEPI